MNRKAFISSLGATCANWTWSWSFVNHRKKEVIFGIWNELDTGDMGLILSSNWAATAEGRKQPGYTQAIEHLRLVKDAGYRLYVFRIYSSADPSRPSIGPAKIETFDTVLSERRLLILKNEWHALKFGADFEPAVDDKIAVSPLTEGALTQITVNAYERNIEARQKCLQHYGYSCFVCGFDFERAYGELGKGYIHVHHLIGTYIHL